jgi:hypothetical protein
VSLYVDGSVPHSTCGDLRSVPMEGGMELDYKSAGPCLGTRLFER